MSLAAAKKYMRFPNIDALHVYDGTEDSNSYTWDLGSYIEGVENDECIELVKVKGKPLVQKQPLELVAVAVAAPVVVVAGGGSNTPPDQPEPAVEFDDEDFTALNNEWLGCTDQIESIEGYLDFEETDYRWETSQVDSGHVYGETQHGDGGTVTIYSQSIATNWWGVNFDNMMMQPF